MLFFITVASYAIAAEDKASWKVGVVRVAITPEEPMYLAGFSDRAVPAEGTAMDLFAKALAMEDAVGRRFVMVTLDLIDVPRQLRTSIERHVAQQHQLPREAVLLNCSHTHCGPELCYNDDELAERDPQRADRCRRYNKALHDKVAKTIDEALDKLAPARLSYSHARCGFAMNRRLKSDQPSGDPYLNRPNPDGVVDHDVPVLKVEQTDGTLAAVVFGYACHNTTLRLKQYHGDYAGHAQAMIEQAHPGTTALFMMGCGGDQNGYPRTRPEFSELHGRALATAVEAALEAKLRPLAGPLRLAFDTAMLDYQPPPSIDRLKARRATEAEYQKTYNQYERDWDRRRLREMERGTLVRSYSAPVQIVRFGGDLTFVALPGETVVDYSLRLKRELAGPDAVWIAGYSNDVFAYVPSKRVLLEGGYEAERAMMYRTNPVQPGPFEPTVEERLVAKVLELLQRTTASSPVRADRH
jgi:hypothetical protein